MAKLAATRPADPRTGWTFLSNYAHVIILLARDPDQRLRDIAAQVGITERAVQRIIADLEADGFIAAERIGRRNTYTVDLKARLRHPIEAHHTIADLVALGG